MRLGPLSMRQISWWNVLIVLTLSTVVFNEWVVYWVQAWRWPTLQRTIGDKKELTVLLVADPQLVGFKNEPYLWGSVTRWDCYRYLTVTFSLAYTYVRPDLVAFLGDLIDEGSTATDEQYLQHVETFAAVYRKAEHIQKLYVHGDNDVGGEAGDLRTQKKINRFHRHFSFTPSVTGFRFSNFITLDYQFSDSYEDERLQSLRALSQSLSKPVTVLLNHESVLNRAKFQFQLLLRELHPNIIFTGHVHTPHLITCTRCESPSAEGALRDLYTLDSPLVLDTTQPGTVHEIVVPTCSYRMGVPDMGFGVAIIKGDGQVTYDNLWLPARYTTLKLYLVPGALWLLSLLWWVVARIIGRPRNYRYPASWRPY